MSFVRNYLRRGACDEITLGDGGFAVNRAMVQM